MRMRAVGLSSLINTAWPVLLAAQAAGSEPSRPVDSLVVLAPRADPLPSVSALRSVLFVMKHGAILRNDSR